MSSPASPLWAGFSVPRGRAGAADAGLRVSDAERAEVADRLSRHYSDGRLDQAEFDERLDRAMKAKTRADLSGLFADLPGTEPAGAPEPDHVAGPQPWHRRHRVLFLVLVIVAAVAAGHALAHLWVPWLLIALLVLCAWWLGPRRHRRS